MGMLKRVLIFILILIGLGLLSVYYPRLTGKVISENDYNYEKEQAVLIRAVDGDTIKTDLGAIRLLGINTPEKGKDFYQQALDFLKKFENKSIEILRDFEDLDKYDRKLRYVFCEDGLLNIEILEQGLGTSYMIDGLKYEDKLIKAESYAKQNEIGLWEKSKDKCAVSNCIELNELNAKEEYFILENNCDFNCYDFYVKDDANHFFTIKEIKSNEEIKTSSKTKVWNDDGDRFFMRASDGGLVLFYEY